jgi:glycosyltransferase involved in cell wall biosynthesis
VVIPCYNAARFLGETLASVLGQTAPPAEVIVVDDGSQDESAAVAVAFGPPVRVVRQENQGECAARNRGIDEARGDWIAFLDADDVWEPRKLELQLRALEGQQGVACVHTGFYLFGTCRETPPPPEDVLRGRYEVESLLLNPLVNTTTAMVRRGLPPRCPVWARQGGDMIYFTELSAWGKFLYVPEPLAGYRMHAAQVTREARSSVQHFQNRFRWLAEHAAELGPARADALGELLRGQVVEWINVARWTRNWGRYEGLREYARTLPWKGGPPSVLSERLYPRLFYHVKDWVDARLAHDGRQAQRPRPGQYQAEATHGK